MSREKERTFLQVKDLHIAVEGSEVIQGVTFDLHAGEKIALMGPNGSGKSTLANTLMGHPGYRITGGRIHMEGEDITEMPPDDRARRGLFLAFQYPLAVPGVTVATFLMSAVNAVRGKEVPVREFRKELMENFKALGINQAFAGRYLNEGFSGGEKKRLEILQMAMLKPKVALMDETDSGLDIDALKVVSKGINRVFEARGEKEVGMLLVTHYQRILDYVTPDRVFVLMSGRIVKAGGAELAHQLEERGYDWIEKEVMAGAGSQ
ncbi:MAG: Fe-S cluster assembly ATPase SufC [Candidatus Eisenbacteria bacterium]|nr:Fe-S cluster assembly ATPase SufC [Candidatus Eisenbacteria bacterium]